MPFLPPTNSVKALKASSTDLLRDENVKAALHAMHRHGLLLQMQMSCSVLSKPVCAAKAAELIDRCRLVWAQETTIK